MHLLLEQSSAKRVAQLQDHVPVTHMTTSGIFFRRAFQSKLLSFSETCRGPPMPLENPNLLDVAQGPTGLPRSLPLFFPSLLHLLIGPSVHPVPCIFVFVSDTHV